MTQVSHPGEPAQPTPSASTSPQVPRPSGNPDTSQAAAPAPPSAPPFRLRLRTRNWEKVAAITAAAAAATGLIFSAWTTYISQEIARDQLSHSKDQDIQEDRSQAILANAWVVFRKGTQELVVVNRSLDPIKDVTVGIIVSGYPESNDKELKVAALGVTDAIPPCSKVEIKTKGIYATDGGKNVLIETAFIDDYFLAFRDANAKEWEREKDGEIRKVSQNSPESTSAKYRTYLEMSEFDGPHQVPIDEAMRSYSPFECGEK
ncbi:hypothetical protein ABZ960_39400 [Streptomyces pseudovenezuelae]|uniref:hypothetical protein n=1 Tax=Streptomyces pseudovenezuelae TaxID=67350 RepID=UPI0034A19FDC